MGNSTRVISHIENDKCGNAPVQLFINSKFTANLRVADYFFLIHLFHELVNGLEYIN